MSTPPLTGPRCSRHRRYFLASCEQCRAAQAERIARIRQAVAS